MSFWEWLKGLGRDSGPKVTGSAETGGESESSVAIADNPPAVELTANLQDGLFQRFAQASREQGWDYGLLFPVMANESGLSPTAGNPGGGAYGLIQDTHHGDIRHLTAEQQAPLIVAYYKAHAPYKTIGEVYGETFLPGRMYELGRDPSTVLTKKGDVDGHRNDGTPYSFYDDNWTLDYDKDGRITIEDLENTARHAASKLGKRYDEAIARYRYWARDAGGGGGSGASPALIVSTIVLGALAFNWFRR